MSQGRIVITLQQLSKQKSIGVAAKTKVIIWNDPMMFQIDQVDCDVYSNDRCGVCSAASFCNSRAREKIENGIVTKV